MVIVVYLRPRVHTSAVDRAVFAIAGRARKPMANVVAFTCASLTLRQAHVVPCAAAIAGHDRLSGCKYVHYFAFFIQFAFVDVIDLK